MIEWMQRHKKWLVITIWISTISFIAAGMVGWGSYNFSLDEGVVAKVGNLEVTQKQLENRYRQLYAQYNTDGQMDDQKAKALGLEDLALKGLIEQTLLLNLALDLGLRISHQEVIDKIAELDYFHKDGKFDPSLYKELLKQNNIRPAEFEEDVQNDLLIQKIVSVVPFGEITKLEKQTFSLPLSIQDKVQIKILTHKDARTQPTQEQLQEFWKQNQTQFQYPATTKIEYVLVNADSQKPTEEELQKLYEDTKGKYIDQDGNIKNFKQVRQEILSQQKEILAEDKALREYVALKKSTGNYGQEKILSEGDKTFGLEVLEALEQGKIGETFKPIKTTSGFIIFKILDKTPKSPKSFEDAKQEALVALSAQKAQEEIEDQAKTLVKKGFEGINLGFITQNTKIKGLSQEENQIVLSQIFTSNKKRNYISLQQKIVLFEITQQKLAKTSEKPQNIDQLVSFYKGQVISKEFYKYLQNQYKITTFKKEN
ncbi:peptidylprolyl isomerase [Helicobacter pametensis]|uniref:peptidylprolyl isomerase n=1 Tax=Helicobacter pametensis TaxID=95149 RepID=UPI00048651A1|nr:peptidylprolyl isomerase [Helicobacter pametensis]